LLLVPRIRRDHPNLVADVEESPLDELPETPENGENQLLIHLSRSTDQLKRRGQYQGLQTKEVLDVISKVEDSMLVMLGRLNYLDTIATGFKVDTVAGAVIQQVGENQLLQKWLPFDTSLSVKKFFLDGKAKQSLWNLLSDIPWDSDTYAVRILETVMTPRYMATSLWPTGNPDTR
jgi:hypothetical protein